MSLETKRIKTASIFVNAILTKLVLLGIAYFAGTWLDQKYGTKPYLVLLCFMIALILGFWWIVILAQRAAKDINRQ